MKNLSYFQGRFEEANKLPADKRLRAYQKIVDALKKSEAADGEYIKFLIDETHRWRDAYAEEKKEREAWERRTAQMETSNGNLKEATELLKEVLGIGLTSMLLTDKIRAFLIR